MTTPIVTLSPNAVRIYNAEEWERWKDYVAQHIDGACNFEVRLDFYKLDHGPEEDQIEHATEAQEKTIREVLQYLRDAQGYTS